MAAASVVELPVTGIMNSPETPLGFNRLTSVK